MAKSYSSKEQEHDKLVKEKFEEMLTKLDDIDNGNKQIINRLEQIIARLPNQ